jgi:hypothetical protein
MNDTDVDVVIEIETDADRVGTVVACRAGTSGHDANVNDAARATGGGTPSPQARAAIG